MYLHLHIYTLLTTFFSLKIINIKKKLYKLVVFKYVTFFLNIF